MSRQRGFTLLESLVALALLSVGLLGAAGMLLGSLRAHADALQELAATRLAGDMAQRIRANPRARGGYDTRTATPAAATCNPAAPCPPAVLAAADLAAFLESARQLLPGAGTRASIHFEPAIGAAAADRYAITLSWRAPRDAARRVVALSLLAAPVAG